MTTHIKHWINIMIPKGIDVSGYYRANLRLNNRINFQKGVVSDMKKDKLDITYPCEWDIKVIGATEKLIRSAIDSIIKDRSYIVSHSRTSKAGKYISLNIKLTLLSEKEKHDLYTKLSEHKDIKFVL